MSKPVNLFGDPLPDAFTNMRDRLGVWPMTVWPCDMTAPEVRDLKSALGDDGEDRAHARHQGYNTQVSLFNPCVAQWLISCFGPTGGKVYDPFGGGACRAIVCAKNGLEYRGLDIRQAAVDAGNERIEAAGVAHLARIEQGDARAGLGYAWQARFLLTCPPYYNMEEYSGGRNDLSMARSYGEFLRGISGVAVAAHGHLCTGAHACWVVGLHRNLDGRLLALHHDIARCHTTTGLYALQEEIVLHQVNNGAIQRVGSFDKGRRRLIRVHEYALVFKVL